MQQDRSIGKRLIGWAAIVGLTTGLVPFDSAEAWEIYSNDRFRAQLDTTLSIGGGVRLESHDNDLIFRGNDPNDRSAGSTDAFFSNADDGNLNYDKGDVYSVNVKSTFDLELDYRVDGDIVKDLGAFVRASAFYDFIGNCPQCTRRTDLTDPARTRKSVVDGGVVGAQWIFLDMYGDALFDVVGRPVQLRVGNQVLSWGESLFIPGGISATNAFDVTKLRIPGSELKEAFVPAPIIRVSGDVIGGFSLEGYYQFDWNRTNVDPTGSYFATSDLVGRGSDLLMLGSNDPGSGCTANGVPDPECTFTPLPSIPRGDDVTPSDQGQFGFAGRYFWDRTLMDFGLYYIRYHSKRPSVGVRADGIFQPTAYFRDYGDDIDLVGFSFNSEVLSAAVAGEVSYRPNDPTAIVAQGIALAEGRDVRGFVREKRVQAQVSMIATLGPGTRLGVGQLVEFLRMDSIAFTAEMGMVNYPDLGAQCPSSVQPLLDIANGTTTDCTTYAGVGPADSGGPLGNLAGSDLPRSSGVDDTAWGYSFLMLAPYTNPVGVPITLTPSFGFSQDFHGTAPDQTFIEGRKAVTLGLELDYLETWGGQITYANFFGGGNKNLGSDRDFFSFTVSYSF